MISGFTSPVSGFFQVVADLNNFQPGEGAVSLLSNLDEMEIWRNFDGKLRMRCYSSRTTELLLLRVEMFGWWEWDWSLPLFIFSVWRWACCFWWIGVYFSWDKHTCTSVDLDRPRGEIAKPPASLSVQFRGFCFCLFSFFIQKTREKLTKKIHANNAYSTKYIFTFGVLSELCFFQIRFF